MAETRRRQSTKTLRSLTGDRSDAIERRTERPDDERAYDDAVAQRAYELYERRGREDGHDLDDWLQAEADMRALAYGD